ncbi:tRNA(Ile2) 2-agmatinylcytidine synthetase TiaS [Candidatus Methanoplasma termitum]|uniref:tRNA(Ile2) 2-agmatinylcytidine synthetase TiaS n=2 Tax=Candidatus Methanoplasma termitum TaxID=1577791 RepID=A0A0A7LE10_9ARCH|nr:tRNA(Ile2) 2-agmatinylcytidine synthetase TiaS [Candidatus Methanoplasma termitum]
MYVAVDDTDSLRGNCTTFLATEILSVLSKEMDLIGYPRLIRLNPAVPWKTRGNASLSMRFGKGRGKKTPVGSISGRDIFCFESATSYEPEEDHILDRIIPVIDRRREPDSDTGLIVSRRKPNPSLYWKGVRTILDKSAVEDEIERIGAFKFEAGCGRGIIGAACGMAWRPRASTLELLTYRPEARWGTERIFDPLSIREADRVLPSTFNSWEERTEKVAMVPGTPCPIMYGLRGNDPSELMKGKEIINSEPIERWMVFLTNQGTDDHIIYGAEELIPNRSYYVEGRIVKSRHISGGHVLTDMDTRYGRITVGAYEPSKEFRYLFDNLSEGDTIGVMGELREEPRTLNAEKVHVLGVSDKYEKVSNPICQSCGRTMESIGKGKGYRCRKCHTSAETPQTEKALRWIREGWYEPPAAARRHLSKPLKMTGTEPPLEFVNMRM